MSRYSCVLPTLLKNFEYHDGQCTQALKSLNLNKCRYTDGLEKKVMSELEQAFTVETHYENHIGSKPTIKHWIVKF